MSSAPSGKNGRPEAVTQDEPRRALVDLFRERGDVLLTNRDLCHNLLNDLCPDNRPQAFVLASMVREGLLSHAFSSVDVRSMIMRLADQAEQKLGVKREHALWAAESWALAAGKATEDDLSTPFVCSHCKLPGNAETNWCERTVICPRCKARLSFDRHRKLTHFEGGEPPSRASEATCWLVIDEADGSESLTGRRLRSAIRGVLDLANCKPSEKAKQLELRRVIGVLEKEARKVLNELDGRVGLAGASVEELIEGVLRAFQPFISGLHISDELNETSLAAMRKACGVPPAERIVGAIDFAAFGGQTRFLVFGVDAIYYCNSGEFIPRGPGNFRLEAMGQHGFTAIGLHSISFGDSGEVLDTTGSGVSKRTLLLLFNLICTTVADRAASG